MIGSVASWSATNSPASEEYLPYDVLIGADGVRSVVRNGIQINHRDFECRVDDIFATFKAVHVALPPAVGDGTMTLLPNSMPNMNGIALPEKGGSLCMSFGYNLHRPCDEELTSDDPKVVAAYVKENFKAYDLVDYDDFAAQWCNQKWNTTGQVHCNFYHSNKLRCMILGDAAHATSPSIGMGMNTALADASALNRLLDKHGDDSWDTVLPAFSEERVKEGQALSDLAFYLFSFNTGQQLRYLLEGMIRNALWKVFPSLVYPDPQTMIGLGYKLSEVYHVTKKIGIIDSVHATNDTIRREYWEKRWGMVKDDEKNGGMSIQDDVLCRTCCWTRRGLFRLSTCLSCDLRVERVHRRYVPVIVMCFVQYSFRAHLYFVQYRVKRMQLHCHLNMLPQYAPSTCPCNRHSR